MMIIKDKLSSPYAYVLIVMLALMPNWSFGQQQSRAQQIEAIRVGFITRQLSLTPQEAAKFWPVYNTYSEELEANRKKLNQLERKMRQAYMDDDSRVLEGIMDEYIETKANAATISLKYHEAFKEVLPVRKVAMLYKAESDMRERILEALKKRQQENRKRNMQNRGKNE